MSGGGSGGSGTQQYNWNPTMQPLWQSALTQAQNLSQTPYQQYPGQRIADLNADQTNAIATGERVLNAGGLPVTNAANSQGEDTLNDMYLTGNMMDPYANRSNPYSGYGPMFQQQLQGQLGDTVNAYKMGTDADTTRMFNQAGAFGGSAYQNAVGANQYALAKQLGNQTANAYQTQFNNSGQLQAQDMNRGSQAYQDERNREMQAMNQGTAAQQNFFQGIQQQMGLGDIQRGYQQDLLNQGYNDWQTQRQYPFTMEDYLTGVLGRAQGGISPNMSFQNSGYSASPYSQILGAGLLGYGALHG